MHKAIIVDDEQHCIIRLNGLIHKYCGDSIQVVAVCNTAAGAIQAITTLEPELVFLDVELQETTGMELLRTLPQVDFEVIFTTAHEKYALHAFKFSAVDYLLKPIDGDELASAVNRLNTILSKKDLNHKFEVLFQNLNSHSQQPKKIIVPSGNKLLFLEVSQIIRCESDVNYTHIYLKDQPNIMVAKTLKEFEELLTENNFFRIHSSHLINLAYVKTYHKGKGGTVTLTDNTNLEVSTRRKDLFLKKIAEI